MTYSWGPEAHGYSVVNWADTPATDVSETPFVDVETTEDDVPQVVGACAFFPKAHPKQVFWFGPGEIDELKEIIKEHGISGHNAKADIYFLFGRGMTCNIPRVVEDTMILAYSHDTTLLAYGLKELAAEFLCWFWPSYRDIVGKGRKKHTMEKQPLELVRDYCAVDTTASYELSVALRKRISESHLALYDNIELPTYNSIIQIESLGVRLDRRGLQELSDTWGAEKELLEKRFADRYGEDFNPNSPKQIKDTLLPSLNIRLESTGKDLLKPFKDSHPQIADLLRLRAVSKLRATYAEGLLQREEVIHCSFNQVVNNERGGSSDGIDTTRLSSSDPNLQNIPSRTEEGRRLRKCFIPRDGFVFCVMDYSQIEYRLLAHFSEDPFLFEAYFNGEDLHKKTAAVIFGVSEDQVTDSVRDLGKTINFAVIYGAQPKKIAKMTGKTEEECQRFLNVYFSRLPGVSRFVQLTKFSAHMKKSVTTLMGRQIPILGISSSDRFKVYAAERKAVNYKIQASAAEIMKIAMIRLVDAGYRVCLTVHDEFVLELPVAGAAEAMEEIRHVMTYGFDLKVPLEVSGGLGETWENAKKK